MSYQRDFAEKINVGIIGIGSHGYRNILPLMNYLPVKVKASAMKPDCCPKEELSILTEQAHDPENKTTLTKTVMRYQ